MKQYERIIEQHTSVNGLVDIVDKGARWNTHWTTSNDVKIPYSELTKQHATNIYNKLKRENHPMNPLLLKRLDTLGVII